MSNETFACRISLAAKRFAFWDSLSRQRRLDDFESRELEHAMRQMDHVHARRVRGKKR